MGKERGCLFVVVVVVVVGRVFLRLGGLGFLGVVVEVVVWVLFCG